MRFVLMVLGLMSLMVSPGFAQSPGGGLLNAVVYKDVPAGSGILVRPLDDSDDNLILKREFEAELQRQGYRIEPDSELVLTFETRDSIGAYTDRNARHVLELSGGSGSSTGETARARVNVFDSASGGLINPGSESGNTEIVTPTQYRLDVTLDDKANRKRLWQAWATADIERSDGLTLTRGMVPFVVQAVGQTVRQQPFKIR